MHFMHGQSSDFPISNEVLSDGGLCGSIQFDMLCVFMAAIGFHTFLFAVNAIAKNYHSNARHRNFRTKAVTNIYVQKIPLKQNDYKTKECTCITL